jgi:hypothetical protein
MIISNRSKKSNKYRVFEIEKGLSKIKPNKIEALSVVVDSQGNAIV